MLRYGMGLLPLHCPFYKKAWKVLADWLAAYEFLEITHWDFEHNRNIKGPSQTVGGEELLSQSKMWNSRI